MRKVFTGLAIVQLLTVLAQFFFAASGGFSTAPREESYAPHHALGYVIFILSVLVAAAGALARVPGRLIGWSASIAGLVTVQVLLGVLARALNDTLGPIVFGLHAVNAMAIAAISVLVVRQARAL